MNVVVLTPDRVGSTLLQRLITIYMLAHEFDKPVINLHELTNGLEEYFNLDYNRVLLGKPREGRPWGYHQSLKEIVELLAKNDHYKTCRLAHYHIQNRNDPHEDQIPFYKYINDNFFVISARRDNLFEHGLSWGIYDYSKHLNVYTHDQKIDVFYNLYRNGVRIQPDVLRRHLDRYRDYVEWSEKHFRIASYFDYEKDMKNIEDYILNLTIYPDTEKKSWNDIFGIEWRDWNKVHKMISDVGATDFAKLPYNPVIERLSEKKPTELLPQETIRTNLSLVDQDFLLKNGHAYNTAVTGIVKMVSNGTLVTGVPIKLQTLSEKRKIVKNFDECMLVYNQWVKENGIGKPYTAGELKQLSNDELNLWYKEPPEVLRLK